MSIKDRIPSLFEGGSKKPLGTEADVKQLRAKFEAYDDALWQLEEIRWLTEDIVVGLRSKGSKRVYSVALKSKTGIWEVAQIHVEA